MKGFLIATAIFGSFWLGATLACFGFWGNEEFGHEMVHYGHDILERL